MGLSDSHDVPFHGDFDVICTSGISISLLTGKEKVMKWINCLAVTGIQLLMPSVIAALHLTSMHLLSRGAVTSIAGHVHNCLCRPGAAQPIGNSILTACNVVPSQDIHAQQPISVQAAEAKVSSSSETQSNPDLEKLILALEAANGEKDAKIREQAAEINWLNQAPARIRCLLDARNKRIEELEGINNSLLDDIEGMKHAQ